MKLLVQKILILIALYNPMLEAVATTESFSFAVVPQQAASKLAKLWVPILKYVSADTGINIKFKTATNIPVFEQRLARGEYDFAYMNPYHYVVFHEVPGYQAFAKQMNKHIKGIIVVHKDSEISSLQQFEGKTLVFPSPAAFAASILTRGYLQKEGVHIQAKYVSSHDSVYFNIAKKIYPAGGGIIRTLKNTSPEILNQLKILWISQAFTPHAFTAHPRVDRQIVEKVRDSLRNLDKTEQGRALLKTIEFAGIEAADNTDWDDVRALNLNELNAFLK